MCYFTNRNSLRPPLNTRIGIDLKKKVFEIKCFSFPAIERVMALLNTFSSTGDFDSVKDLFHTHVSGLNLILRSFHFPPDPLM